MNTGLGDATNLAWKLANVYHGSSTSEILDTYEPERIDFARKLVKSTDRAFRALTSATLIGAFVRSILLIYIMPFIWRFSSISRRGWKMTSQLAITYRHSQLSQGKSGSKRLAAGDRLPWIEFDDGSDNFESLKSCAWVLHVYGEEWSSTLYKSALADVDSHFYPWTPRCKELGLVKKSFYLVRPDGHIGCISHGDEADGLLQYISKWCSARRTLR